MRRSPLHAVSASVLVSLLLGGCAATQITAPPTAAPTPTPVLSQPAGTACVGTDLDVTSTGWGGAAGSRGADVMVENVGDAACSVDAPVVAVVDEAGTVLLQAEQPAGATETTIEPGSSAAFSLTFSNWCDASTPLPLRVALVVGRELLPIEGLPLETVDDLPPCNGEGQPASLSTIPWAQG